MSAFINGVQQSQSSNVTPQKLCIVLSSANSTLSQKLHLDLASTDIINKQSADQLSNQSPAHSNQSQFVYPSAFSSHASPYIHLNDSPALSNICGNIRQFQQCYNACKTDPLDKVFKQIEELKKNVEKLQKVTNKCTKIYHDSTVIIKGNEQMINEELLNGRIIECESENVNNYESEDEGVENYESEDEGVENYEEFIVNLSNKLKQILTTLPVNEGTPLANKPLAGKQNKENKQNQYIAKHLYKSEGFK